MIESAQRPRKSRKGWLAAIALAAAALLLALGQWLKLAALPAIGAGYAAQQTCACLFISGRELQSCRAELDPLARWLVSVRPTGAAVTARAFAFARATARYDKEFGCTLED